MNEQTSLPPEIPLPSPDICAWCGAPSTVEITLEPHRFGYENRMGHKVKVLKKRAITAKACTPCHKRLKFKNDLSDNKADSK